MQGDFRAGVAGIAISTLLLGLAAWMIRLIFVSKPVYQVTFWTEGVTLDENTTTLLSYADFESIIITIQLPSDGAKAMAALKGATALLSGNALGVGRAYAASQEGGSIVLTRHQGRAISVRSLESHHLEAIATYAMDVDAGNVSVFRL